MKVVIIGGVAAGMSTAAKLKRTLKDKVDILVFEKGEVVSFAACGIPYYVSGKIAEADSLIERTVEEFAESGIVVKTGHEAVAVDTAEKTVSVFNAATNETIVESYDKLVVASGARVRKIPPLNIDAENLHVVRDVADGVRLRAQLENGGVKKVVIVGAGFIGLEVVEACAKQGKEVLLIEFAERILPVLDPEITDRLVLELQRNKVDVRTGSKVVELVMENGRVAAVVVECGKGRETIPVDLVVNSVGIVPNAEFIDVEKAVNGAIVVNDRMETSAPDVYAAGDCSVMTSFITQEHQYAPLGTNANKQGRIIAELLAGKKPPRFKLIGSSALKLFDLDAAKVGLSETDAQRLNLDYKTNLITGNSYASYYSEEKLLVKLVYEAKTRKILGAQTCGQGVVVPRANYFAIAIAAGMRVDDFGFLDLCYSPPFSGVWDATMIAANTAK